MIQRWRMDLQDLRNVMERQIKLDLIASLKQEVQRLLQCPLAQRAQRILN